MTKEQLISFIDKNIPDGELVNVKANIDNKTYFLNIIGVDDDSCVGVWNLCGIALPTGAEEYYDTMISSSVAFEKSGYSMEGKQWFDVEQNQKED